MALASSLSQQQPWQQQLWQQAALKAALKAAALAAAALAAADLTTAAPAAAYLVSSSSQDATVTQGAGHSTEDTEHSTRDT